MTDNSLDSIPDDILAQAMVEVSFEPGEAWQFLPSSPRPESPATEYSAKNSHKRFLVEQPFCSWMNTHGISFNKVAEEESISYSDEISVNNVQYKLSNSFEHVEKEGISNPELSNSNKVGSLRGGCYEGSMVPVKFLITGNKLVDGSVHSEHLAAAKFTAVSNNIPVLQSFSKELRTLIGSKSYSNKNLKLHSIPGTDCYLVYPENDNRENTAGTPDNPINLILKNKWFYCPHRLVPHQVQQIILVLQKRKNDICNPCLESNTMVIYDKSENIRIHYRAVNSNTFLRKDAVNGLCYPSIKRLKTVGNDSTKSTSFSYTRSGRISKPPKHLLSEYDQTCGCHESSTACENKNFCIPMKQFKTNDMLQSKESSNQNEVSNDSTPSKNEGTGHSDTRKNLLKLKLMGIVTGETPFGVDEFFHEKAVPGRKRGRTAYKTNEEKQRAKLLSKISNLLQLLSKCSMKEILQVVIPKMSKKVTLFDYFYLTLLERSCEPSGILSLLKEVDLFFDKLTSFLHTFCSSKLMCDSTPSELASEISNKNSKIKSVRNILRSTLKNSNQNLNFQESYNLTGELPIDEVSEVRETRGNKTTSTSFMESFEDHQTVKPNVIIPLKCINPCSTLQTNYSNCIPTCDVTTNLSKINIPTPPGHNDLSSNIYALCSPILSCDHFIKTDLFTSLSEGCTKNESSQSLLAEKDHQQKSYLK